MSKTSRAKRILPPIGGVVSTTSVLALFKNQKVYFLTINPHKRHKSYARFQSIGKVSDRLRSRSRSHFIVREEYKEGGYHFHAICTGFDDKPIVGLRVHCQTVGPKVGKPEFDPDVEPAPPESAMPRAHEFPSWWNYNPTPIMDFIYLHLIKIKGKCQSYSTGRRARARNNKRMTHLQRVVTYMFKEHPTKQYTDWCYCGV